MNLEPIFLRSCVFKEYESLYLDLFLSTHHVENKYNYMST